MNDEYHAYDYVTTFVFSSGTGFDQSARGLAALSYIKVLPAVRQVVCRHPSPLLPKVAARRIDCPTGKSQGQERMPTRKTAKDQRTYITRAGLPPRQPATRAVGWPASRSPCCNLRKLEYLPSQNDQVLLRPQTAEQLSGWEGGGQGKAAKEKAKG